MEKELFKIQACTYFRYDDPDKGEWVDLLLNQTRENADMKMPTFVERYKGTYCGYRIIKQKKPTT